jgi:hypothetical protein
VNGSMSDGDKRRALARLLALMFIGAVLASVILVLGFRDRSQPVLVDRVVFDIDTDARSVVGQEERVLTCPGPFASMDRIGAYYPVDARVVWPTDGGVQPMPCEHNRTWLQVLYGIGLFGALGTSVLAAIRVRAVVAAARSGRAARVLPTSE